MSGELNLSHVLQGGYFNKTLREWHATNTFLHASNFILPLFIHENDAADEEIPSLPGVRRLGMSNVRAFLDPVVADGLRCVLLFGVIDDDSKKDETGSHADNPQSAVIRCIPKLRDWYPELLIACDVCLCAYTVHGHCGVFHKSEVSEKKIKF
jgi:porphobilinogen synthase